MSTETIFRTHLVLGYVAWILCFGAYIWPWLRSLERDEALRAIATLHSFRFFGLVFLLPGVIGPGLPAEFAAYAAYGDFAAGMLAILALVSFRIRPLFLAFTVGFNVVGIVDLLDNYYRATLADLPAQAGEFGATYAIPIIYVPLLMITHVVAFYLLMRSRRTMAAAPAVAS
jgi:hypothetical protein